MGLPSCLTHAGPRIVEGNISIQPLQPPFEALPKSFQLMFKLILDIYTVSYQSWNDLQLSHVIFIIVLSSSKIPVSPYRESFSTPHCELQNVTDLLYAFSI